MKRAVNWTCSDFFWGAIYKHKDRPQEWENTENSWNVASGLCQHIKKISAEQKYESK